MKKICAWCNKELPFANYDKSATITHGICSDCAERVFKISHPHTILELINRIKSPIVVIKNDTTIALSNKQADRMLKAVPGDKTGDAIECSCAQLPGGCGKTIHCKACTIRRTIQKTRDTGKSYSDVKAYQNIQSPEGTKRQTIKIATEKIWDTILVRIDEFKEDEIDKPTEAQHAPWSETPNS